MMQRKPAAGGIFGVVVEQVGRAVGRHDPGLVRYAELGQPAGGVLHDLPVGVAAHHDAHQGLSHGASSGSAGGYTVARVRSMVPRAASAACAAASRAMGTRYGEQET